MVSKVVTSDPQAAPGELESVRRLLNTWRVPNDLRQPVDEFDDHAARAAISGELADEVRQLRDDLRSLVERRADGDVTIGRWIDRLRAGFSIRDGRLQFVTADRPAGDVLRHVLDAVDAGSWTRLKACPDCRWVFYDNTRNGRKRWCLMNAGAASGRGCGNIAKVRRYRARQRMAQPSSAG